MTKKQLQEVIKKQFLLFIALFILATPSSAIALGSIPSPTDVPTPSGALVVYKVHHWNALNVDKIRDNNDEYNVRTDFNFDIANEAWQNENITALSLNEVCRTSVEGFAAANGISSANYEFMDYQGSSSSYVVDNAACAASSGVSDDKFGQAMILRGTPIEKQTYRNTGIAAGAGGNRGLSCVKTTLDNKTLASCTMHTAFDVAGADDRFEITRQQVRQNEINARSFAQNGTIADHLFLPGDYNLSTYEANNRGVNPAPASANNPDIVLSDYFHGYNTNFTFPSVTPNRTLDYIYASTSLRYASNTPPICSGSGITNANSIDTPNYTGDHCYIGAIFYTTSNPSPNPTSQSIIPGAPKAGDIVNNSVSPLVTAAVIVSSGVSYLIYRRRRS